MVFTELSYQLKKSKYSLMFFLLACFQLAITLGLLIPALFQVKQIPFAEYEGKSFKVSGEYIMFILFEVWRICLVIDGIASMNSKTIYASASFTILSFLFSIMMIAESVNWSRAMRNLGQVVLESERLRQINLYLQIGLASIILIVIPPTFIVAHRTVKDIGWDVYKKIGSDIKIQGMFNDLQWLSLCLKIDVFFQFFAYILFLLYERFALIYRFNFPNSCVIIIFACVLLPFFVLCRYSVSIESRILMILFILFQIGFLINTVYTIVTSFSTAKDWYAYFMYSLAIAVATIITAMLAIKCLFNFNKGLKPFVVWHPFKKTKPKRQSGIFSNANIEESLRLNSENKGIDTPIDD